MSSQHDKIIIFDCDSTLSSIEGVDELARVAGEEATQEIEKMTAEAMEGKITLESIFAQRLSIIQPTADSVSEVGKLYIETVEPSAKQVIATLKNRGWTPIILSGGYRQAIKPLADYLGVELIEAVDLYFHENGSYRDFDRNYPSTRSGGKPEVVKSLRDQYSPDKIVAIGDGVSDLESKSVVDMFIGFGRYAVREKVKQEADYFITDLQEIIYLVDNW
ncbi:HAD-IB family phosphatase [Rivularia sp. UHCC 0363]|uniref:HAD-IB family phosphatase n=1 Tax=Rivularia sp. UHCC 0363 TaxID=3110244 RepID=UPI002B20A854|nr:HAD-IB family phosphatase [Rivularia sp. UHCC 0363]MEA5593508.1 HAD-IB family phosphatase [Rivularia sp. UHCC 0363]